MPNKKVFVKKLCQKKTAENADTNLHTIQTQVQMLKKENINHKEGNARYKDTNSDIMTMTTMELYLILIQVESPESPPQSRELRLKS